MPTWLIITLSIIYIAVAVGWYVFLMSMKEHLEKAGIHMLSRPAVMVARMAPIWLLVLPGIVFGALWNLTIVRWWRSVRNK